MPVSTRRPPVLAPRDYVALARFRAVLRAFLRSADAGARAAGLTPQQHQLLLAIRGRPGREWAGIGELAAALQVRHHTAVGLVDRCAALGLVRRSASPVDRRRVRVLLTAKGARSLERLTQRTRRELLGLRRALDPALLGLSPSQEASRERGARARDRARARNGRRVARTG